MLNLLSLQRTSADTVNFILASQHEQRWRRSLAYISENNVKRQPDLLLSLSLISHTVSVAVISVKYHDNKEVTFVNNTSAHMKHQRETELGVQDTPQADSTHYY